MKKKTLTVKERVIKRLNEGFGFNIPLVARWRTHQKKYKDEGGNSWYFSDANIHPCEEVGSCDKATKCLSWKRWVLNQDTKEISEYFESESQIYELHNFLIENINKSIMTNDK